MIPLEERLLTLDETAEHLRCSRSTVDRLVRSGQLRTVVVGSRRRLVRMSDLNDYIREAAAL